MRASVPGRSTNTMRRGCLLGARAPTHSRLPDQDVPRVVELRNWSVHYRPQSYSHDEPDRRTRIEDARARIVPTNALMQGAANPWFPEHALGAGCAACACARFGSWSTSSSTRSVRGGLPRSQPIRRAAVANPNPAGCASRDPSTCSECVDAGHRWCRLIRIMPCGGLCWAMCRRKRRAKRRADHNSFHRRTQRLVDRESGCTLATDSGGTTRCCCGTLRTLTRGAQPRRFTDRPPLGRCCR